MTVANFLKKKKIKNYSRKMKLKNGRIIKRKTKEIPEKKIFIFSFYQYLS